VTCSVAATAKPNYAIPHLCRIGRMMRLGSCVATRNAVVNFRFIPSGNRSLEFLPDVGLRTISLQTLRVEFSRPISIGLSPLRVILGSGVNIGLCIGRHMRLHTGLALCAIAIWLGPVPVEHLHRFNLLTL